MSRTSKIYRSGDVSFSRLFFENFQTVNEFFIFCTFSNCPEEVFRKYEAIATKVYENQNRIRKELLNANIEDDTLIKEHFTALNLPPHIQDELASSEKTRITLRKLKNLKEI